MDFRKIDNNTVQCIVSEEEMNAYGFQVEDFFSDQEKSRDFLEQLVERAEEEVGYESKGGMVSMQIMKMPNNDLAITFSERDPGESFQNILQHLHQQLTGLLSPDSMEQLHSDSYGEDEDLEEAVSSEHIVTEEEYAAHMKEVEKRKRNKEKKRLAAPRVYHFESLPVLERFAASVVLEKPIPSIVYKDTNDDSFYLLVKKGKLKMEEYLLLCQQISEFAMLAYSQPMVEQYCREHFEVFIPKQAIRILKMIETGQ